MSGSSPKVRASSETIGATSEPTVGSRTRLRSSRANTMVVDTDCLPEPGGELLEDLGVGSQRRRRPDHPDGQRAVEDAAPGPQVLHGVGALGGADVGRVALERGVGDVVGQVQAVAQRAQLGLGHLLDLVRGVARLDLGAERPPLDRLGQDDGRGAPLLGGQLVGGVELAVVVAAAGERHAARRRSGPRPSCAGGGRGRRSAPGCRPPTRRPASGTRRRPSCSSGRAGRRRRPWPAARPSASPRSP